MSDGSATMQGALSADARALIARAGEADARARTALAASIDDAFLSPEGRLDDRTRTALATLIAAMVGAVEGELIEQAGRLLSKRGDSEAARLLGEASGDAADRLARAGLLRDEAFAAECLARVRLELLSAALPTEAGPDADTPSLLARLAQSSDRVVATAAAAVMIGESARRSLWESGQLAGTGLPQGLHTRLVWWIAAAIRERVAAELVDPAALDRALAEAALRNLAAHDDADRMEAGAMRLAEAIDAQPGELAPLVEEVLRDRRPSVLAAFLAHALGVRYEVGRDLLIEPFGDRLWLVLRALELPRAVIARVGFNLCEADPHRDVEIFADTLDVVASVEPDTARLAVAPLRLHPDYRSALLALSQAEVRR